MVQIPTRGVRSVSEVIETLKDKIAVVEKAFATHEAVCGERYKEHLRATKDLKNSVDGFARWMLLGFAVIALMTLLGPRSGLLDVLHEIVAK